MAGEDTAIAALAGQGLRRGREGPGILALILDRVDAQFATGHPGLDLVAQVDERLAGSMLEDWEGRIIAATRLFDDALPVIERLRGADLRLGIVTNGYWAVSAEDAEEWLRPLSGLIGDLSVSSDESFNILDSFSP